MRYGNSLHNTSYKPACVRSTWDPSLRAFSDIWLRGCSLRKQSSTLLHVASSRWPHLVQWLAQASHSTLSTSSSLPSHFRVSFDATTISISSFCRCHLELSFDFISSSLRFWFRNHLQLTLTSSPDSLRLHSQVRCRSHFPFAFGFRSLSTRTLDVFTCFCLFLHGSIHGAAWDVCTHAQKTSTGP